VKATRKLLFWWLVGICSIFAAMMIAGILLVASESIYDPPKHEYDRKLMDDALAHHSLSPAHWLRSVADSQLTVQNFDHYYAWALLRVDSAELHKSFSDAHRVSRRGASELTSDEKSSLQSLVNCIRRTQPEAEKATEILFLRGSKSQGAGVQREALFFFEDASVVLYAWCV
jgi:hypothetical protein